MEVTGCVGVGMGSVGTLGSTVEMDTVAGVSVVAGREGASTVVDGTLFA